MNRSDVIKKYRKRLIKSYIFIAFAIMILEIIVYFLMKSQALKSLFFDNYFLAYLILPTSVNALSIVVMILIERSDRFKERQKNASTVYGLYFMALNVSCVHSYFWAVSCCLTLPMLVSCIYGDRRLMRSSVITAFFSLFVSAIVSNFEHGDVSFVALNSSVTFIMIVVAYMLGSVMIDYSEENIKEIENRIVKEHVFKERLKRDQMTGLLNQNTFYEDLEKEVEYAEQNDVVFALAIIDIDNFKHVNDTYGHEYGDIVLKKLSRIMTGCCDVDASIYRYGGEEFAIIFKNKTKMQAKATMDQVLRKFREAKYRFTNEMITLSCGICDYNGGSAKYMFRKSDAALYEAKQTGKNRIVVDRES